MIFHPRDPSRQEILKLLKGELEKNAHLLIGVDDPEVNELINVLIEAISKTIYINNKRLQDEIIEYIDSIISQQNNGKFI